MTVQTESKCSRCGERHISGPDGFYRGTGKDRHPFTPGPIEGSRVVVGHIVEGNAHLAGWVTLEKCGRCKAVFEPADAEAHERHHLEVLEGLAVAWQLLNGKTENERKGAA